MGCLIVLILSGLAVAVVGGVLPVALVLLTLYVVWTLLRAMTEAFRG